MKGNLSFSFVFTTSAGTRKRFCHTELILRIQHWTRDTLRQTQELETMVTFPIESWVCVPVLYYSRHHTRRFRVVIDDGAHGLHQSINPISRLIRNQTSFLITQQPTAFDYFISVWT